MERNNAKYLIRTYKGYWLQSAYGYTKKVAEAGVFTLTEMQNFNLDGCTLIRPNSATDLE